MENGAERDEATWTGKSAKERAKLMGSNFVKQLEWCDEAPPARDLSEFYTLDPLTTDPAGAGRPATITERAGGNQVEGWGREPARSARP